MHFTVTSLVGALVLQGSLIVASHKHAHEALHVLERRHRQHSRHVHKSRAEAVTPIPAPLFTRDAHTTPSGLINSRSFDDVPSVEKRGSACAFPTNVGLVAVTSGSQNGGWAIPPDRSCTAGMFCPYACPSGQVMAQWDPSATSYTYPASMNGGLKCNSDGTVSKPFPDKPYCTDASGLVKGVDKTGKGCAFCQTQLPGDESMVIPTNVQGSADIAIPGPSYWAGTAAHYYLNPPGVSTSDGCQWGSSQQPWGNWAPYVAGGNQVDSGEVFLKVGWNPIYLEQATPFRSEMPTWGVEVVCDGDGCNGLPCAIDPSKNQVNQMVGGQSDGAGGAAFCVVTVPKGVKASIVVFDGSAPSGSSASASPAAGSSSSAASSRAPASSSSPSSLSPSPASSAVATSSAKSASSSSVGLSSSTAVGVTSTPFSALSSSAYPSYSYAPHEMLMNATSLAPTGSSTATGGSGGVVDPNSTLAGPSKTSPIASAKETTGAAVANSVSGRGLAAFAAIAAFAVF